MSRDISWAISKSDLATVREIVKRYFAAAWCSEVMRDVQDVEMDLIATHANGCRMDFKKLLAADDSTLAHDLYGIAEHIDRDTGKLTRHFVPKCAKHSGVKQ